MTRNQLPEGVGKKIVEALKRQAEADITPVDQGNDNLGNNIPLTDIQDLPDVTFKPLLEETDLNDNIIVEEEPVNILPQPDAGSLHRLCMPLCTVSSIDNTDPRDRLP